MHLVSIKSQLITPFLTLYLSEILSSLPQINIFLIKISTYFMTHSTSLVVRLYCNHHYPCKLSLHQQKSKMVQFGIDKANLNLVKNNNLHVTPVLLNHSGWCQELGELKLKTTGYIVKIESISSS
jgi:hypothetical protein